MTFLNISTLVHLSISISVISWIFKKDLVDNRKKFYQSLTALALPLVGSIFLIFFYWNELDPDEKLESENSKILKSIDDHLNKYGPPD